MIKNITADIRYIGVDDPEQLLFENLRINRQAFLGLDFTEMEQLASLYQTKNHKLLRSWIRKEIRHATDT